MALTPTHPPTHLQHLLHLALMLAKVRKDKGMTPKLCRTHSYYLTFVCAAPLSQLHQTLTTAYIQPHSFAPAPEHWSTRALENPSLLAGEHQPENMTTKKLWVICFGAFLLRWLVIPVAWQHNRRREGYEPHKMASNVSPVSTAIKILSFHAIFPIQFLYIFWYHLW